MGWVSEDYFEIAMFDDLMYCSNCMHALNIACELLTGEQRYTNENVMGLENQLREQRKALYSLGELQRVINGKNAVEKILNPDKFEQELKGVMEDDHN